MIKFIARRLLLLIPVLFLISAITFALLVAMPGDPLDLLVMGDPSITRAEIEQLKALYGVNDPMPVRYVRWLGQVIQGNFGYSRTYNIPVTQLVWPRLQNTLILTTVSLLVSLAVSLPLGIYSAVRQYSASDYLVTIFAFIGFAIPNFWLGLMLIILFSVHLGWLPPGGIVSIDVRAGTWESLVDRARYLVMPVFVLGLSSMADWTRYMRASVLEVIKQDFVLTARAKGLNERVVIYVHVLKNALIPVVTLMGNTIPIFLGGSIIVETVFSYPGIGKLLYDSVLGHDFSVTMAILLFLSLLVVIFNLVADIAYGFLDPRIQYE
jgi:peptide/nickel transport system permease protein